MAESASEKLPTGLVLDPVFKKHDTGPGHPERIGRYTAITDRLTKSGLAKELIAVPTREATNEELSLAHHPLYVELAVREITEGKQVLSTGDTSVCEHSLDVAKRAAGAAMNAVDLVMKGKLANAFCAVRPPGHHATPSRGMGFCVFNNVAVAARYAQKKHGIKRVAILDWDVHHGNGTQDIFYEDDSVYFFSTHQWPLYPGTGKASERGKGKGEGNTLNCPFPAGSGMKEIGGAFRDQLEPALDKFKPELIILSAGFDSRIDDPLGGFTLTDANFSDLTKHVMAMADKHAQGRLISCLEGGYNVDGLASAAESHVRALMKR